MSASIQPGPIVEPQRVWSYAGFWWRALALLIDGALLQGLHGLVGRLTGWHDMRVDAAPVPDSTTVSDVADLTAYSYGYTHTHHFGFGHAHVYAMFYVWLLFNTAYFVLLESSRWQATIGKRICRLRVTDLSGRRLTPLRALGRYLGKILSWLILLIGFLMAGWTRRKQALHDLLADTLVMRLRPVETVFAFRPPA